ncbi:MAG: hypothetical protein AAGI50_00320 [Pseudomonadota bacterium]
MVGPVPKAAISDASDPVFKAQNPCIIATEARTSAQFWGQKIGAMDHEVRPVPTADAKPFAKRQKNSAKAIAQTALPPSMRFVTE